MDFNSMNLSLASFLKCQHITSHSSSEFSLGFNIIYSLFSKLAGQLNPMVHSHISLIFSGVGAKTSVSNVNFKSVKKMKYWQWQGRCRRSNVLGFQHPSLFFRGFLSLAQFLVYAQSKLPGFVVWVQS